MSSKKNKQKRNISFKKKGGYSPTKTMTTTSDQKNEIEQKQVGTITDYRPNEQYVTDFSELGKGTQLQPIEFTSTMDTMVDDMEKLKYSYDYLLGICQGNCSDMYHYILDANCIQKCKEYEKELLHEVMIDLYNIKLESYEEQRRERYQGGKIYTDVTDIAGDTDFEMSNAFLERRMYRDAKKENPMFLFNSDLAREDYIALILAELKQPFENHHDFKTKSNVKKFLTPFDDNFSKIFSKSTQIILKNIRQQEPFKTLLNYDSYKNEFGYMIAIFKYLQNMDNICVWKSFNTSRSKLKEDINKVHDKLIENGYIYNISPEPDEEESTESEYFYCGEDLLPLNKSPNKLDIKKLNYQFKDAGDVYKKLLPLFNDEIINYFKDNNIYTEGNPSSFQSVIDSETKTMFPFIGQLVNSAMLLDPATRPPVKNDNFNIDKIDKITSSADKLNDKLKEYIPDKGKINDFQKLMNINNDESVIARKATTRMLNGMFKRHGVVKDLIDENSDENVVYFTARDDGKYDYLSFTTNTEYHLKFDDLQISNIEDYLPHAEYRTGPSKDEHRRLYKLAKLIYDNIPVNEGLKWLETEKGGKINTDDIFKMIVLSFKADGDANQVEFVRHLKNILRYDYTDSNKDHSDVMREILDVIFVSTNDKNTFTQAALYDIPSLLIGPSFKSLDDTDIDIASKESIGSPLPPGSPGSSVKSSPEKVIFSSNNMFKEALKTFSNINFNDDDITSDSVVTKVIDTVTETLINENSFKSDTQMCISTFNMNIEDTEDTIKQNIIKLLKEINVINQYHVHAIGNLLPALKPESYFTQEGINELNDLYKMQSTIDELKAIKKFIIKCIDASKFYSTFKLQLNTEKQICIKRFESIINTFNSVSVEKLPTTKDKDGLKVIKYTEKYTSMINKFFKDYNEMKKISVQEYLKYLQIYKITKKEIESDISTLSQGISEKKDNVKGYKTIEITKIEIHDDTDYSDILPNNLIPYINEYVRDLKQTFNISQGRAKRSKNKSKEVKSEIPNELTPNIIINKTKEIPSQLDTNKIIETIKGKEVKLTINIRDYKPPNIDLYDRVKASYNNNYEKQINEYTNTQVKLQDLFNGTDTLISLCNQINEDTNDIFEKVWIKNIPPKKKIAESTLNKYIKIEKSLTCILLIL